jgi:hypothetical protein
MLVPCQRAGRRFQLHLHAAHLPSADPRVMQVSAAMSLQSGRREKGANCHATKRPFISCLSSRRARPRGTRSGGLQPGTLFFALWLFLRLKSEFSNARISQTFSAAVALGSISNRDTELLEIAATPTKQSLEVISNRDKIAPLATARLRAAGSFRLRPVVQLEISLSFQFAPASACP